MKIVDLKSVPEHLRTLAEWHHDEWSYINPQRSLAERIDEMYTHLGQEAVPTTLVAEEEGRLLGSASVLTHDMDIHQDKTPWLASVYVASEARRSGLGSALVRQVMAHTAAAGLSEMFLYTMDQEALYQRLGWQTLGREIYHGVDVIIMRAALPA